MGDSCFAIMYECKTYLYGGAFRIGSCLGCVLVVKRMGQALFCVHAHHTTCNAQVWREIQCTHDVHCTMGLNKSHNDYLNYLFNSHMHTTCPITAATAIDQHKKCNHHRNTL